jgi:hypothetical protein
VQVFASTFDNIGNDFPLHSSFLPFVEQTARYLGRQHDRRVTWPWARSSTCDRRRSRAPRLK